VSSPRRTQTSTVRRRSTLSRKLPSRPTQAARPAPKPDLYIRLTRDMGRGVFAGRRFRKGEIIEICPVIPLSSAATRKCQGGVLERYVFAWTGKEYPAVIALGYGSIYNHSDDPNARFYPRPGKVEMVYRAVRDIEPGEQIFVDYEWKEGEFDIPPAAKPAAPMRARRQAVTA
jgi:uncharacterized protein